MTHPTNVAGRNGDPARPEVAASWFARLNAERVSTGDLQAFQTWRQDPKNDRAYRRVELLWSRGEELRGDPEIARALSAALNRRSRPEPFRGVAIGFATAAVALLAVTLGLWVVDGPLNTRIYQTAIGQQHDLRLADGSQVRLDTDSRVAIRLGPFDRRVALLQGRAFFTVAHDMRRPFIVAAADARVRAVGTRFSVERAAADVRVILVQGVVQVSSRGDGSKAAAARTLRAGQQLTVDGAPGAPEPVDLAQATSWMQGHLVFRELPLRDAIAEVNRYTPHKLVLEAPSAAEVPVSGVFDTRDPVAFATAAADVCGLVAIARADGSISLRMKGAQPPG